ncbi:Uncharacterized protein dnl_00740 [Desulfonema limicola]|uniref:Uncharacterized protein n=1 Tax=Desulfonema limicola TaxID=45656 RepID=A0A975GE42_9BACT|nr:Uncharacterized protein dnl_00740 [Desulfonema limicola]
MSRKLLLCDFFPRVNNPIFYPDYCFKYSLLIMQNLTGLIKIVNTVSDQTGYSLCKISCR